MVTKLQDQVGHEGMLQLVRWKGGMPSDFMVMVKLVNLLLRSGVTQYAAVLSFCYNFG